MTFWQIAPGDAFQLSCTISLSKYHTTRLEFERTRLANFGARNPGYGLTPIHPFSAVSARLSRLVDAAHPWGNGGMKEVVVPRDSGIRRVLTMKTVRIVTLSCKKTILAANRLQKPGQWSITWA